MKISFVIPAYNEESYIGDCLRSVLSAIAEYPCDAEIVVVNNASTDSTRNIAQTFAQVRVVDEPRKGLVWARAAGARASSGDLIANIDADTRIPSGWIKKVFDAFGEDKKLVALSGPYIYDDLPRLSRAVVMVFYGLGYVFYLFNHYILHIGAMLQGGNYVVLRTALDLIGGYDTSISFYGEDTDIARRISRVGKVRWTFGLPMYTSARRLKGEGIVTMGAKYALNYLWISYFGKPFTHSYIDIREKKSIS